MKKFIIYFCLALPMILIISCTSNTSTKITKEPSPSIETDSSNIETSNSTSQLFSQKEIQNAINCVIDNFDFPYSKLTKVWYDEEKSKLLVDDYLKSKGDDTKNIKIEDMIILLANFDVDPHDEPTSLEPNSTYKDYLWILIKNKGTNTWKIIDSGY
ncbi:MAG: hypothetical protein ACRC41_10175 [Sarcina sp.]